MYRHRRMQRISVVCIAGLTFFATLPASHASYQAVQTGHVTMAFVVPYVAPSLVLPAAMPKVERPAPDPVPVPLVSTSGEAVPTETAKVTPTPVVISEPAPLSEQDKVTEVPKPVATPTTAPKLDATPEPTPTTEGITSETVSP